MLPGASGPFGASTSAAGPLHGGPQAGQPATAFQSVTPPAVSLPKGGGAIRGVDERFQVNPATGTGSLRIPIATAPGRGGFGPTLALRYDSGAGNGPFGLGWSLALPNVSRKTDRGVPRYRDAEDSDTFLLTGAEDLVPALVQVQGAWLPESVPSREIAGRTYRVQRYRPRVEGLFARIEHLTDTETGEAHWRVVTRDNVTSIYGSTAASRIADPAAPGRVFCWLLEESFDDKGNVVRYEYKPEDASGVRPSESHERNRIGVGYANRYLKRIVYGNSVPYFPRQDGFDRSAWDAANVWRFQVVFDYGEHADDSVPWAETQPWELRPDSFSQYRAGFEIRTQRRCRRVMLFHCFPDEAGLDDAPTLVRATEFAYEASPVFSYLTSSWQTGYMRAADGTVIASSLPPVEFAYSRVAIDEKVRSVDAASLVDVPGGLGNARFRLIDLDGEGIAGLLTEQGEGWYYKRNLGTAAVAAPAPTTFPPEPPEQVAVNGTPPTFAPARPVRNMPVAAQTGPNQLWLDLAGDGKLDLVVFGAGADGFYEREDGSWASFIPFRNAARVDWSNPNQRLVDLSGDGHADILVSEDLGFRWYPSLAEEGFGPAETVARSFDEERGPALVFADASQSIYLADMNGDGLVDLVRLRNGEICYWPSLGYGRFGAKITMSRAPRFDAPDQFDQQRVRLADIDGSGTTDVIYLHRDGVHLYFNQAGNGWSEPVRLAVFPPVDDLAAVTVADLTGNGTACLVWSSALPADANQPLRYVDLMGGQKPHLLSRIVDNMGTETTLTYAPSTRFYLADDQAGRPWVTRLPFPVHVVEAVEVRDRISQTRYVTRYAYHHGYFDGQEREFRGFGMVEQWDSEILPGFVERDPWPERPHEGDAEHHLPPTYTRTWLHTGAYRERETLTAHYANEYYAGDPHARLLPDTVLPDGLTPEEAREACRALRGKVLRREIFAVDGAAASPHPYAVIEQNFAVRLLQPRREGRPAVFLSHARESIEYHYERNPADPRITHSFTLEVDDYGNVTRTATVAYPRRTTIPDRLDEQTRLHLTCNETDFVNLDEPDDCYLIGVPYQSRGYEITGLVPTADDGCFTYDELRVAIAAIPAQDELPYEATPAGERPEKRLLFHSRTRYYAADLTGPLDWGEVRAPLLPYESQRAVFGRALLEEVFGPKIGYDDLAAILQGQGGDQGGYLFADGLWWAPSGRLHLAPEGETDALAYARAHFYLPVAKEDPFGQRSRIGYDEPYFLFPTVIEDPVGNVVQATIDYRVLQPTRIVDPNGNRSEVAFDALGLVVGTAVQGKATESVGDTLEGFVAEPGRETIRSALDSVDPRAAAQSLIANATSRVVYDFWRYYDTRDDDQPQPNVIWSISRETHASDLAPGERSRLQLSFRYFDGLGREVLTKVPAEPGPLQVFDRALGQWQTTWAGPGEQPFAPRWVGTGRTVYNNKGLPIKKYEPFFSATHRYEREADVVMQGVTPILSYDPLGRVIRTDLPNKTLTRVAFGPWQQATWDQNDTVRESDWYADRGQPDPFAEPEPSDPEHRAAWLAAEHAGTPAVQHLDPLGQPFLSLAHNRVVTRDDRGQVVEVRDVQVPTWTQLDVEGNLLQVQDGRGIDSQPSADPRHYHGGNVVLRYRYAMGGSQLYQWSTDAGERWVLPDVAGNPIRSWDSRGHAFRTEYDALRRPIRQFVRGTSEVYSDPRVFDRDMLFLRIEYGEGQPNDRALNLRTRAHRIYGTAGIVTHRAFDFKGNLLRTSHQLAANYRAVPDWSATVPLEPETYTSSTSYDALNRPVQIGAPHAGATVDVVQPGYNEAGLPDRLDLWLRLSEEPRDLLDPATATHHVVANVEYNARGQRTSIVYGNGTRTSYGYDVETFRLVHLQTVRGSDRLQDLAYTLDPIGNVVAVRDAAQQTFFFDNTRVAPDATYVYDALYQLVGASGREHVGQAGQVDHGDAPPAPLPHPNNAEAMRRYHERYAYDAVGNILAMVHQAVGSAWTRQYAYAADSNRLLATSLPGDPRDGPFSAQYDYDPHGSMTRLPHLAVMRWDFRDQLQASSSQLRVDGGVPETTYYVYDANGQRVRKVTDRQAAPGATPTRLKERVYLGGFEIYREYSGDGVGITLERETLHLLDGEQRVALVETKVVDSAVPVPSPQPLIRYQLTNHLGSTCLELDAAGRLISYEEYHPFGTGAYRAVDGSLEVNPRRYRFTGKERDEETGLCYHGARYYACWLARWTSADPSGPRDGANLYRYVGNRPTVEFDPNGRAGVETTVVAPFVRATLDQYGILYATEVRFEFIDPNSGDVIEGRFDLGLLDPRTGEPDFLELKGLNPNARSTRGQATYMSHLLTPQGGTVTITGVKGGRLNLPIGKSLTVSDANYGIVYMGNRKDFAEAVAHIAGGRPFKHYYQAPDEIRFFQTTEEFNAFLNERGILSDVMAPSRRVSSATWGAAKKGLKRLIPVVSIGFGLTSAKAEAAEGKYFDATVSAVGVIPTPLTEAPDIGRTIGELINAIPKDVQAFWEWWTTPTSEVDQWLAILELQNKDPERYRDLSPDDMEWNGTEWVLRKPKVLSEEMIRAINPINPL